MYGYHENLTKDELFEKVNQEEVFRHVFGNFNVGEYLTSPFREDGSPGCWIEWHNGKLYFSDFGSSKVNHDMIGIIQLKYNLSFKEAIDFISSLKVTAEPEFPKYKVTSVTQNSTTLEFCAKPFDAYHKAYWSQYDISSSQLIQDNIFATKWYRTGEHFFYPLPSETTYTISYSSSFKICRPKTSNKKLKWITNASKDVIGGTKNLPFLVKTLYITKSYKDWRVLTNLGLDVIYFQNEGMLPDMEILHIYLDLCDDVIVLFDNDDTGIKAAHKVVEYINSYYSDKATSLILPTKQKDPADIVKAGKKQELINFLFH